MTSQNTTTVPVAPTLTESELFALFVKERIVHRTSFGATSVDYRPEEWLRDPGADATLEDAAELIAERIEEGGTENDLENAIFDIEIYLDLLRQVRTDFRSYKSAHLIDDDADEEGAERYRVPDPSNGVDFIEAGGHPTPEPDFIGEDDDTGVGAPPA